MSYYDHFLSKQAGTELSSNKHPSLVDRNAYLSFLEVEMDRVSAACLTVNAYRQRISQLESENSEFRNQLSEMKRNMQIQSAANERAESENNYRFEQQRDVIALLTDRVQRLEQDLQKMGQSSSEHEKITEQQRRCVKCAINAQDTLTKLVSDIYQKLDSHTHNATKPSLDLDSLQQGLEALRASLGNTALEP